MFKRIVWLSPPNTTKGKNVMVAWKEYMKDLNWELIDEVDKKTIAIFCGSESQLERAFEIQKGTAVPIMCYCWGFPYFRLDSDLGWQVIYKNKIKLLKACASRIVPFMTGKIQMADFFLDSSIVEPGVDDKLISAVPEQEPKNQVIYLGRLVPHKDIRFILEAINLLENPPEFVAIGTGDPETIAELQAIIKEAGLKVRLLGDIPDEEKIKELKSSLALISASKYEGFGMPTAEAMWADVPALTRDTVNFRWVYKDTVQYFSSESELALLIRRLQRDNSFRNSLIRKAEPSKSFYSFSNAALRLDNLFSATFSASAKFFIGQCIRQAKNENDIQKAYDIDAERNLDFHAADLSSIVSPSHWRVKHILPNFQPGSLIDIGCSYGVLTAIFARYGMKPILAIDISPKFLELARNLAIAHKIVNTIEFKHGSIMSLPTNDNFDNVFCGEVIEHLFNDQIEQASKECIRVCRVGGKIILTTPNKPYQQSPLHLQEWSISEFDSRVLVHFRDNCKVIKIGTINNFAGELDTILVVMERIQ